MTRLLATLLLLLCLAGIAFFLTRDEAGPQAVAPAAPDPAGGPGVAAAQAAATEPRADFVEENACVECHPEEVRSWQGSNHDLAMQPATAASVLGDFDSAEFEDAAGRTRFYRRDGGYFVETTGADGRLAEFPVPYVFGVEPLQQLLLPLERGRLQALSIAWDVPGQRWFSLYPGERIDADDPLHWTRPAQNWNFVCAECHATDLVRGYDPASDAYHTTWSRLDVGCQACHGPAAEHVTWARTGAEAPAATRFGFAAPIGASSRTEVEACARCHARRAPLADGFDHRHRLMDDYLPALLEEGLYHADGQILDEVYEYGSFLQSKMHARGVRCSDCHDPHSQRPRLEGNALCTRCHSPAPTPPEHVDVSALQRKAYDVPGHHFHQPGTPGSHCVDCHMVARNYMVVDPRRDHSFRVPRPDLALGTPDACTSCHVERDAAWASAEIERLWGKKRREPHFGSALQAGRSGKRGAADLLLALVASEAPAIARATAYSLLPRYPGLDMMGACEAGLADPDPLVRHAAMDGLELLPPNDRAPLLGPLVRDPIRAVRVEAARRLVGAAALPDPALQADRERALDEYRQVQATLADRSESHLNLAQLWVELGQPEQAERELVVATRLEPAFAPAWVNLADLVRGRRSEAEAEALLRQGLEHEPRAGALQHALGLSLVRQGRSEEGLAALKRAAELAPAEARFGYVYAIALHDTGHPGEALEALRRVLDRRPEDRDTRLALAGYLAEVGDEVGSRLCLEELAAINPHDPGLPPAGPGR